MNRPEITGQKTGHQLPPGGALVATPNETMTALHIARAKLYGLINAGELESYTDGGSRKILWSSIHGYIARRLAAESELRGKVA
jgi:hypothetical protein